MEKGYLKLSSEVSIELIYGKIKRIFDGCNWYQVNGNESSLEEFEKFNCTTLELSDDERKIVNELIKEKYQEL